MLHHGSGPTRRNRPDTSDVQTAISLARSTTMKNPIAAWVPRFVQLTNYGNALFSDSRNPLVVNTASCRLHACRMHAGVLAPPRGWRRELEHDRGSQALPPLRFLTVDPVTPSTLYAVGVSYRGIFKSIDGGASWISIKSGQGMSGPELFVALAIDPETPSTVYAPARVWPRRLSS